jgi:hypothetical protein
MSEPLFPDDPSMAGYRKIAAESPEAAGILASSDLYFARMMQNTALAMDGGRICDTWTPEQRQQFAAERPEAWAQAAAERAAQEAPDPD